MVARINSLKGLPFYNSSPGYNLLLFYPIAGIGILTTRGTGTSGYVQTNRFNLRGPPPQHRDASGDDNGPSHKQPNKDILEHNRKREIELEVETMRAQLEDDEYV